ncbi:hypothetical protein [Rhizobium paknamense]|uniref:Uncharacterized protein n=1 Tax=Rhizobium paknamense TaxID=1206817 RepID=A0ABU0I9F9_9HYPH|nr:hypothetical protein [Rhizobium paknamense]MDQ0454877.1 hypothetical protein [Rhizobium paknamense]
MKFQWAVQIAIFLSEKVSTMNFCVYLDNGHEVHGYFVPDGFSKQPKIHVRVNGEDKITEINCWIYLEGAKAQGAHETGNVAFVLSKDNVPGIDLADDLEIIDPDSGLVFYRRDKFGKYIPKKVFRLETSYVPQMEIDLSLKPYFQFFEHRVENYGFETVRQMLEIIHQPSVYVSGRVLLKNYLLYIDYNIDTTLISLRDPFYELATRLIIFSRFKKHRFRFVTERDKTLFLPVIEWFSDVDIQDEGSIRKKIRSAPKDTLSLLSSPFTHQLIASSPSDVARLDDVSRALDRLSQFTLFDAGRYESGYADNIAELLNIPVGTIKIKPQLEPVHQLADILRSISTVEHILEADLILYHFIQKAEHKAFSNQEG